MVKRCCLCFAYSDSNRHLIFFSVPKLEKKRKEWSECFQKRLAEHHFVCSRHFDSKFIISQKLRSVLNRAIPANLLCVPNCPEVCHTKRSNVPSCSGTGFLDSRRIITKRKRELAAAAAALQAETQSTEPADPLTDASAVKVEITTAIDIKEDPDVNSEAFGATNNQTSPHVDTDYVTEEDVKCFMDLEHRTTNDYNETSPKVGVKLTIQNRFQEIISRAIDRPTPPKTYSRIATPVVVPPTLPSTVVVETVNTGIEKPIPKIYDRTTQPVIAPLAVPSTVIAETVNIGIEKPITKTYARIKKQTFPNTPIDVHNKSTETPVPVALVSIDLPDPTVTEEREILPVICVLCAKDLSKIRTRKPIKRYTIMIRRFMGVDITEYPVLPIACHVCYKSLRDIDKFTIKVNCANRLIKERFSDYFKSAEDKAFEFAAVDTDINADVNKSKFVNENDDSDEVMEIESVPQVVEVIDDSSNSSTASRDDENAYFGGQMKPMEVDGLNKEFEDDFGCFLATEDFVTTEKAPPKYDRNELVPCPVCEKYYKRCAFYAHLKCHSDKNIECTICKKSVRCGSLKTHMVHHRNKKNRSKEKLCCTKCGKLYSTIERLRAHEVVHGEKKHMCNVCGVKFHYDNYLQRHMRSHSGEKPYTCKHCKRSFSILWNLHQHERLHTDSKPYKCLVCSATFRHNVTLKGHLAAAHTAIEIATCKEKTDTPEATVENSVMEEESGKKQSDDKIPDVTNSETA